VQIRFCSLDGFGLNRSGQFDGRVLRATLERATICDRVFNGNLRKHALCAE
jgi:hypothetical protein